MKISEIFYSIQGEGKLTGVPSVFIRSTGCNLRCTWCDTPYTSWAPEGAEMSIEQILQSIRPHPARHAVFTGGEPLIMPEAPDLCRALKAAGYHITVETAATLLPADPSPANLPIHLASISPKLANSTPLAREGGRFAIAHDRQRINISTIQHLIDHAQDFQLKFVVSSEAEMPEIQSLLSQLKGVQPHDVLLMPEGTDAQTLHARAPMLADLCKRLGYRYCPRLHVDLFGHTRGT